MLAHQTAVSTEANPKAQPQVEDLKVSQQPQNFNEFMNPAMGQNRTGSDAFSSVLQSAEECQMKIIEMQECLQVFKDIVSDFELDLKILGSSLIHLSQRQQVQGDRS